MKKNIVAIIVSVFGIIGVAVAAPLYIGDGVSTIAISGTNDWIGSANWSSDAVTPTWQTWADGSDAIIKNAGTNNVAVNLSSSVTVRDMAWNTSLMGLTILGSNMPTLTITGMAYTTNTASTNAVTPRQFSFVAVNLAGNMAVSNISRFVLGSGTTISPGTTITNTDKTNIRLSSGSNDMSGLTVCLARGDGSLDCTSNATVGTVTGFGTLGSATGTNILTINNLSIGNSGGIATMSALVPVTLGSGTHTFLVKSLGGTNTASALAGTTNCVFVLGGTLAVQIAAGSDTLESGDVFTLFSSGTNSGSFSSNNLPSLAPSLSWGTDKLVSRGLLYVTDGTFTPPDPNPPAWTGLTVFSDNFNDITANGAVTNNLRGWVATGVPYWNKTAGVGNSGAFFLRSSSSMSRYTNLISAATNSRDFRLKFDCWVETASNLTGYVGITTDSGATWTTIFSLANTATNNIDYDLPGYSGPYAINIDTSSWTAEQLAMFGFRFSQTSTLAADHFNVDNVLLSVNTNAPTFYALTVNSGRGSGSYTNGQHVTITASNLPSMIFVAWTGDTQYLANSNSASTTVTMPAQAVNLTATYIVGNTLTVNNGTGSGSYAVGQQVAISATNTSLAKIFTGWTGSGTPYVASVTSPTTTLTMPAQDITLTAIYNDRDMVTNFYADFTGSENGGAATSTNLNAGTAVGSWTVQNQLTSYTTNNPTRGNVVRFQAGQYTNNAVLATAAGLNGAVKVNYDVRRSSTNGLNANNVSVKNENGDSILEIVMSGGANGQFRISYNNGVITGFVDLAASTAPSDNLSDGIMDSVQIVLCETSFDAYFNNVQVVTGGAYSSSANRRLGKSVASIEFAGSGVNSELWYDNIRVYSIPTYPLTVNGGIGSGPYTNTARVVIVADAPATNMVFDKWTGDTVYLDDPNASSTTVTMPTQAVNLTATYVGVYALTVNGGIGSGSSYTSGKRVVIVADAPATNMVFDKWTGDTVYLDDPNASITTVTMPATNIAVTATYKSANVTLTATAGAGGTISPASASVSPGNSTNFVITANNYYRISTLTTNGVSAGLSFNNLSTNYNFVWSNVQAAGTVTVSFVEQVTTGPAPVPYSWLAQYFVTNDYSSAALADQDADGAKTWQEYIAGTIPTNKASVFTATQATRNVITWNAQSNRIYSVYWTTNLVTKVFTNKQDNVTGGAYTNTSPDSRVNLYQVKVRMQ